LGEQIDALEAEVKEKEEQINDTYGLMIFLAQIGKAEMKRKREEREQ
jgi:hypothetical protein